jgi:putative ABC transport system permease protein
METLLRDVRYGIRIFLQRPAFAVIAVLMLALGIGANTAVFSVVNAVLLSPFPYEEPDRLVIVWERQLQQRLPFMFASPPNYADWRDEQSSFEEMAAFDSRGLFLKQGNENVRVMASRSTASLFSLLKVPPLLGSVFTAENDEPGKGQVVVLSHAMWRDRFGADASLIGRQITLDDQPYTVLGVMPEEFKFPPPINIEGGGVDPRTDLWMPLAIDMKGGQRGAHFMKVIARLAPGVSVESAEAEMGAIAARLEQSYPDSNAGWDATVVEMSSQVVGEVRPALLALLAAVGCVLLIACVNVANLLLARGAARQKEFAIRMSLGAGRARLARQMVTESLVLSIAGSAAGLLLAWWGTDLLVSLAPRNVPRLEEVTIDGRVILFTVAVSLITGLLAGLAPAVQISSLNLNQWLKEGGRSSSGGAQSRLRGGLIVAEVALSLVLLVGAGLLFQSFLKLRGTGAGFNPENVMTLRLALPQSSYRESAQRVSVYKELEQRITALPAVRSAGFVHDIPLAADRQGTSFLIEGKAEPPPGQDNHANFTLVTPGYFPSMGVALVRGRNFDEQDAQGGVEAAIINQALARRFFEGEDPVGKLITVGFRTGDPRRIVGVVSDVRHNTLKEAPVANIYVPYAQVPRSASMSLVVRGDGDVNKLLPPVREAIRAVVGGLPIFDVKAMDEIVSDSLAQSRFSTLMLTAFSAVALVLASAGVYGFLSFLVNQNTHEIGVRMALGARPANIFRLVVGQGFVLVTAGLAIGIASAFALTRFLGSLLYEVSATDLVTYAGVSLLLAVIALMACYFPARRATRVDPMVALRYE